MVFAEWLSFRKNKKNYTRVLEDTRATYKTELIDLIHELQSLEASLWEDLKSDNSQEVLSEKLKHFKSYSQLGVQVLEDFRKIFKGLSKEKVWEKNDSLKKMKLILSQLKQIEKLAKLQLNEFAKGDKEIEAILNGNKIDLHCSEMSTLLKNVEVEIKDFKNDLDVIGLSGLQKAGVPIVVALAVLILFSSIAPSFAAEVPISERAQYKYELVSPDGNTFQYPNGDMEGFNDLAEAEQFLKDFTGGSPSGFSIQENSSFHDGNNAFAEFIKDIQEKGSRFIQQDLITPFLQADNGQFFAIQMQDGSFFGQGDAGMVFSSQDMAQKVFDRYFGGDSSVANVVSGADFDSQLKPGQIPAFQTFPDWVNGAMDCFQGSSDAEILSSLGNYGFDIQLLKDAMVKRGVDSVQDIERAVGIYAKKVFSEGGDKGTLISTMHALWSK